jgi:hypothetical protein
MNDFPCTYAANCKVLWPVRLRLTGEQEHGRAIYELDAPLVYHSGGVTIHVPVGFRTDFASVPRGLWNLFPPAGPYAPAAVIHDYLCEHPERCSRFLADAVFREVMREIGVPWYVRLPVYYAVRTYGAIFHWRS